MNKLNVATQLKRIVNISKKFGAKKVLLFGSCLENIAQARDIDIAISGIPPKDFFKCYGKISMEIKDEVDIIDLDEIAGNFYNRIISKGKVLYERNS